MTASATVAGRAHPPTRQNGRQKGYRPNTLLTEYSRISSNPEETEIALLEFDTTASYFLLPCGENKPSFARLRLRDSLSTLSKVG